ncbi:hypothetical protein GCM10027076_17540 [Nocardioides montaniterrae]
MDALRPERPPRPPGAEVVDPVLAGVVVGEVVVDVVDVDVVVGAPVVEAETEVDDAVASTVGAAIRPLAAAVEATPRVAARTTPGAMIDRAARRARTTEMSWT